MILSVGSYFDYVVCWGLVDSDAELFPRFDAIFRKRALSVRADLGIEGPITLRVLSTCMVECRVSILGVTSMIQGSIPP